MSPTQQWPPATPAPPVVFSPPVAEPERAPEPRPPAKPRAAGSRPFGGLTDGELAEARTEARRRAAQLAAEARRREGKPLGRTGPDRQPRKPWRDRALIAEAVAGDLLRGEEVTVSGVMKSQRCGHTTAVQVLGLLEAGGVVERRGDGRWYAK